MNHTKILNDIRLKIIKNIQPLLNRQNEKGIFIQKDPEATNAYDFQIIYPMAYLYKTKFKGNIFFKDKKILDSIFKIGDYCSAKTNKEGLMYYYSFGNEGYWLDQRLLIFWIDAYSFIKNELGSKQRKTWIAAMKRSLLHLEKRILGFKSQEVFNSYSFNTSPNHSSLYACALYLGGKEFKNKKWCLIAESFMDRFVDSQTTAGYWAEGHGPVGTYCSVSLAGVARINREMNKPKYNQAMLKAFEYFKTISFPDFSLMDLTDKRNKYGKEPSIWGLFGLSVSPEGRAFACSAIERKLNCDSELTGEGCARLLENFAHMTKGTTPHHKNWSGTQYLENHSAFIRKNSWQINYSVNPVVVHPTSSFRLDYGKIFSVWHKKVGLLINGSQDKHIPEHNTFFNSKGESLGVLYGGQLHTNLKEPFVQALYSTGLKCCVKTTFINSNEIKISGAQMHPENNKKDLRFGVPLNVGVGESIFIGKKKITLSEKKIKVKLKKGDVIKTHNESVQTKLLCDGILHFPSYPFNPYTSDNSSSIDQAFLRLELIPAGKPQKAELKITLK